ncbi:MAG: hypothetical protein PUP91_06880 [Rhizonema sp. PD37]|nr:hypothetical protein [Rhizonema sp. PD37]
MSKYTPSVQDFAEKSDRSHEPGYQNQAEIDSIDSGIVSYKFVDKFGYCFKAAIDL